jgi:hypothetical protein
MKARSVCRCLLCQLEIHLKRQLGEARSEEHFSTVAASGPLLSGFPNAFALSAHLRSCRSNGTGTHPADPILLEILHLRHGGTDTLLRDVLLLAFIPVLHTASRQIAQRYPLLLPEDTLQHLVAALLETLDSPKLLARDSHVAFAISRMAKRNTFEWAERQTRTPGNAERDELLSESSLSGIPEPIERAVLLRHFLCRCQREGLLTGADVELLVHIKLEGHLGDGDGEYSNALRQKIKRLLRKLREIAQTSRAMVTDQAPPERT